MKHLIPLKILFPSLVRYTVIRKLLHIRYAGICTVLLIPLLTPNIARAEIIDTYLGMNFVGSYASVPEVQLQKITYIGAKGVSITVAIPELGSNSPYHTTPLTGLPDGLGLSAVPTYITGGDGETTRSFNKTVAIDWDTSGEIPTIQVTDIEVNVPGIGVWTAAFDAPYYTVGLIPDNEVDTELDSTFTTTTQQGDIYNNAVGTVTATSTPPGLESLLGIAFGEFIFSASWAADPVEKIGELATDIIKLNIKKGIATSLDAKLDGAVKTMEFARKNDRAAAAAQLEAVAKEIKAQSGKAITEKDALILIEKVRVIKWGWKKKKYI